MLFWGGERGGGIQQQNKTPDTATRSPGNTPGNSFARLSDEGERFPKGRSFPRQEIVTD